MTNYWSKEKRLEMNQGGISAVREDLKLCESVIVMLQQISLKNKDMAAGW